MKSPEKLQHAQPKVEALPITAQSLSFPLAVFSYYQTIHLAVIHAATRDTLTNLQGMDLHRHTYDTH